jgi:hypothetical protein
MSQALQITVPLVLSIFLAVFSGVFLSNKRIDDLEERLLDRFDVLNARIEKLEHPIYRA